ncbi:conserved hypothetical protein [Coccidioides posadasii str. Silveira]|uniref:Uncharacterized protein n=1 Tax=Coccidioides posadasii (strain RMSCC 757 / Silveira) TaxID=443226 RepID=E9D8G4_COCPS|nr:conserved hypothetical protein [Coccidioides posadasii str. Silveira]
MILDLGNNVSTGDVSRQALSQSQHDFCDYFILNHTCTQQAQVQSCDLSITRKHCFPNSIRKAGRGNVYKGVISPPAPFCFPPFYLTDKNPVLELNRSCPLYSRSPITKMKTTQFLTLLFFMIGISLAMPAPQSESEPADPEQTFRAEVCRWCPCNPPDACCKTCRPTGIGSCVRMCLEDPTAEQTSLGIPETPMFCAAVSKDSPRILRSQELGYITSEAGLWGVLLEQRIHR